MAHLLSQDRLTAERYLKAHLYDVELHNRLALSWKEGANLRSSGSFKSGKQNWGVSELKILEGEFPGELAFHSLLRKRTDRAKYFNEVNKEGLKKNLVFFERRTGAHQLRLIENTNLYLELEDFLEFSRTIVKSEDPQEELRRFMNKSREWVGQSMFRSLLSCLNTFMFREAVLEGLVCDASQAGLGMELKSLQLLNFRCHARNLNELGYVRLGLAQLMKSSDILAGADALPSHRVEFLETYLDLKKKEFEKGLRQLSVKSVGEVAGFLEESGQGLEDSECQAKVQVLIAEVKCMWLAHSATRNCQTGSLAPSPGPSQTAPGLIQALSLVPENTSDAMDISVPEVNRLFESADWEYEWRVMDICEALLRHRLDEGAELEPRLVQIYFELLSRQMTRLHACASRGRGLSRKLPFVFRMIKRSPSICSRAFKQWLSDTAPARLFIGWEQQLVTFLSPRYELLSQSLISRLAQEFPHVVSYCLFFNRHNPQVSNLLSSTEHRLDTYFRFVEGLFELNDPEQELFERVDLVTREIEKLITINEDLSSASLGEAFETEQTSELENSIMRLQNWMSNRMTKWESEIENIEKTFYSSFKKQLREISKSINHDCLQEIHERLGVLGRGLTAAVRKRYEDSMHRTGRVDDYSGKLGLFTEFFYDKILSLEQNNEHSRLNFCFSPDKERPLHIKRLLPEFEAMDSIKRPKKLTILLENNKQRHLLLKFGEDLRTDSRIQKIFGLMNDCLDSEHFDADALFTFGVLPLSPEAGLVEWIQDTRTLAGVIDSCLPQGTCKENQAIRQHNRFLDEGNQSNIQDKHLALFERTDTAVWNNFDLESRTFGKQRLVSALLKTSQSAEQFFETRKQLIEDYALISIAGYLLGIGDRHTENLMLTGSGRAVSIDFGYCFGLSSHLPIPETVPFRLTPNIVEVMKPFGLRGLFASQMVLGMQQIFAQKKALSDFISIYAGKLYYRVILTEIKILKKIMIIAIFCELI